MMRRFACINDLPIRESERLFRWPLGRRPDHHPGSASSGCRHGVAPCAAVAACGCSALRCRRARALRRPWPAPHATPPLVLPLLDGTPWSLAAARGRVVR
jgi:hypothetical protein